MLHLCGDIARVSLMLSLLKQAKDPEAEGYFTKTELLSLVFPAVLTSEIWGEGFSTAKFFSTATLKFYCHSTAISTATGSRIQKVFYCQWQ